MKINKFWGKMKMTFVGIGTMSLFSMLIFTINEVYQYKIGSWIFLVIAMVSVAISYYSNYRRMKELESEKK
jgi:hypothetical protein